MSVQKRRTLSQRSELLYDVHNFGILLDTREIFIAPNLEQTIDDAMIDHVVAHQFIKNLQVLNSINNESILVHLMTCGGDWNYGMAIYDAINASQSDITILSYAHSRSMSSIIPQAATWRIIMPNSDFLIHWGSGYVSGSCTSMHAEVAWSIKLCEKMLDIYTDKCIDGQFFKREGMDKKAIREWLKDIMDKKQEVYMTARESVDKGFMDAVLGDEEYENISVLMQ